MKSSKKISNNQVDLDSKLDKTNTPSSVYGNDENGEPVMIPVSELGKEKYFIEWEGYIQFTQNPTGWYSYES